MENKKLIKVLLKEMGNLDDLIADMKQERKYDAVAMELVHTRAKGIMQLLQLLESEDWKLLPEAEETESVEKPRETIEKVPLRQEPFQQKNLSAPEIRKEVNATETFHEEEKLETPEEIMEPEILSSLEIQEQDNDMLEEETEKSEANSRLGDSFLKGKSVNDLITDQQKLEFKLSNRPVSSIQTAIGINDRFQYIRELFDSDNEKFLQTVKTLDSMPNIREAIEYLRSNFRWKKNETSLKFVNLVKRRFTNG